MGLGPWSKTGKNSNGIMVRGMYALVTVCSWNTNGIKVMHGCSGDRMLVQHERNYGLGVTLTHGNVAWINKTGINEN